MISLDGRPVPGITVVAVAGDGLFVSGATVSDGRGRFALEVPRVSHRLGTVSPAWAMVSASATAEPTVKVQSIFPTRATLLEALSQSSGHVDVAVTPIGRSTGPAARFGVVNGRILDETAAPLAGVRVLAIAPTAGRVVAVTISNAAGEYALLTTTGLITIHVVATGLKVVKAQPTGAKVDFVLGVDVAVETITLRTGEVLTFRMSDSYWPEFIPPPKVKAYLQQVYGIEIACQRRVLPWDERRGARVSATAVGGIDGSPRAGAARANSVCPDSVAVHGQQKYWWVRLLESPPPNPAKLVGWDEENARVPSQLLGR